VPDFSAHAKTQNQTFSSVWRKGSASAPVALRDVGKSPGGCSRTGHLREGPVVEEIKGELRWNCAKVIANIDDLAISIWGPKVIDELSQIDDISSSMPGQRIVDIGVKTSSI